MKSHMRVAATTNTNVQTVNFFGHADAVTDRPLQVLSFSTFVVDNCSPKRSRKLAYVSHPNGGGLRERLEHNHYAVFEASYACRLGGENW